MGFGEREFHGAVLVVVVVVASSSNCTITIVKNLNNLCICCKYKITFNVYILKYFIIFILQISYEDKY